MRFAEDLNRVSLCGSLRLSDLCAKPDGEKLLGVTAKIEKVSLMNQCFAADVCLRPTKKARQISDEPFPCLAELTKQPGFLFIESSADGAGLLEPQSNFWL